MLNISNQIDDRETFGKKRVRASTDCSGYYTYYTADEGKIYYVANAVLKNLKKDKEDMDKLVSADVYYNDGYKYHCALMIERRGRLENLYEPVDPLQDKNVKFAVQLPKEAQTDSKPIKMVFEVGKHKFECSIIELKNKCQRKIEPAFIF